MSAALRGAAGHTARHDHRSGLGLQELTVVFLVAEKTHIARTGGIERGHAGERRIEPAPDDVSIDPTGELGKREGECQLGKARVDYSAGFSSRISSTGLRDSAGASLLRSLSRPAVMSVASLV